MTIRIANFPKLQLSCSLTKIFPLLAVILISIFPISSTKSLSIKSAYAFSFCASTEESFPCKLKNRLLKELKLTINQAVSALKTLPPFLFARLKTLPEIVKFLIPLSLLIFLFYLNQKLFLFTRLGWVFLLFITLFDISSFYILFIFFKNRTPLKIIFFYTFIWLFLRKIFKLLYFLYAKLRLHLLLVRLGAKPFEYVVKFLPSKELNAFAFRDPSGKKYIAVTTHTLKRVSTKELNFIVAHELVHHLKNHLIVKVLTETFAKGSGFLLSLFKAFSLKSILLMIGMNVLKNALYRKQEYEADELAFKLLHSARLDPRGGITFMKRMAEKYERSSGKLDKVINFLIGSHPLCKERLAKLEKLMACYKSAF